MTLEIPNLTLQIQVSISSHQWCIVIISQCGIHVAMEWSRRGRMIINKNSFAAQVSKTSRALNFPPPSQCICMAANPWDLRWIWQIVVRCRLPPQQLLGIPGISWRRLDVPVWITYGNLPIDHCLRPTKSTTSWNFMAQRMMFDVRHVHNISANLDPLTQNIIRCFNCYKNAWSHQHGCLFWGLNALDLVIAQAA